MEPIEDRDLPCADGRVRAMSIKSLRIAGIGTDVLAVPAWVITHLRETEEFIVMATIVCQDRTRAEAIAESCRLTAAERSRTSPNLHLASDYYDYARRALLLGWEGTTFAEVEAFMRAR